MSKSAEALNLFLNTQLHNQALVAAKDFAEAHAERAVRHALGQPEPDAGDFQTRYQIAHMHLRNTIWHVTHEAFQEGARQVRAAAAKGAR